ncbi:MAG: quinone oxidoreductase family protein [Gaiellaceae bacterium]
MRAVVVTRAGGPEVLEVRDEPEPTPAPGQLLVDVEAIGVNFRDVYEREGNYGGQPPLIAGVEGCGTVVGSGERVAWVGAPGSYAERVVVDAEKAVPVPDGIAPETAAAALLQGMTAHYLARSTYPVGPADTAVVHAAAGGVGLLLTQIVKLAGGTVIGTTSSDEKAELARGAGADHVIGYDGFAEKVRGLTDGVGANVVYDGIGAATFAESLKALRPRGMVALYGAASGPPPQFNLGELAAGGSLYVTRPTLVHYTLTREELLERASDVFGWILAGRLDVRIGATYPLEQARQAQEDLQGRRTTGKLILLP